MPGAQHARYNASSHLPSLMSCAKDTDTITALALAVEFITTRRVRTVDTSMRTVSKRLKPASLPLAC